MITDDQAGALVLDALPIHPEKIIRQNLTESGNAVFRVELFGGKSAVLRVSGKRNAFAFTARNLEALRQLGLPVQSVLASGGTAAGGSFIILDWIAGRDLLYELPGMQREQITHVAQAVVDLQKRVGTLPMAEKFGWAPIGKSGTYLKWSDVFGAGDNSVMPANPSAIDRLRALRQSVEPYFATVQPVCFLDDLTLKNVLIDNGELTGIIDVDFVCYGDPLMSVGTTLALIAAEVGDAGQFYGEELVRCWNPSVDQLRAIHFYTALWVVGMMNGAEAAGDRIRAVRLAGIAGEFLDRRGVPGGSLERPWVAAEAAIPGDAEQLLLLATNQHRAGNLAEAQRLYRQVLETAPEQLVAQFRLGLLEMQQGNLEVAFGLIQQVAEKSPAEFRYQFGLGEVLTAMQRWDAAADAYRRALTIDLQSADAQFGLGNSLRSIGDYPGAILAYQAAVRIQPDFADAHNNLGNCFKLLRDLPAAETAYRNALVANPKYAGAMSNLGAVLQARARVDEAIVLLRAAMALSPESASYAVNLGAALCGQRLFAEAQSVLSAAVMGEENNADARYNLGNALHGLGQLRGAAEQYEKAIAIQPEYAAALVNVGNVYKELGEFKLAAAAYASAMRIKPDSVVAINNAGCLLRTMGRLEEAEAILRRGLVIDPNHSALQDNLANVLKDGGQLDEAITGFRRALELDPPNAATHSNLAYALSFQLTEARPILEECLRWNDRHAAVFWSSIVEHSNDRSPDRRLRIGYVSPDFRDHCQSLFTVPLLSRHDHSSFQIHCYCSVERPDPLTDRLKSYADVWRDVRPLDDAALADLIRRDGIDILVDLTMHMADGRPLLFARKPAPVQVAWLAYPGTTGLSAMDYRFSDSRLDPELEETLNVERRTLNVEVNAPHSNPRPAYRERGPDYSERTVLLPDSFWCYDPLTDEPEVNELPANSRGYLTLGCLNNPCKLTDLTLRMWGDVMVALPDARLLLLAPPGAQRERLLGQLGAFGVAGDRVNFVPYRPRGEYLKTYHEIDLGLDTFPYNGHTTSLDSFWMGVPVVTRVGNTCVGRGGLSQLFQLGLLELAGESDQEVTGIVVKLAGDLPRLAALRRGLRSQLGESRLMDAERFARNMEGAYRKIWQARAKIRTFGFDINRRN